MNTNEELTVPSPVVSRREREMLDRLTVEYKKMTKPGITLKFGRRAAGFIPKDVKTATEKAGSFLRAQKIYQYSLEIIATGFQLLEERAARYSDSHRQVLDRVNSASPMLKARTISELCLLRSYRIDQAVKTTRKRERAAAVVEGGATGMAGIWGVPFNFVFSTFLYFRAVQNIALHYGYDTEQSSKEMIIAAQVFLAALNPESEERPGDIGGIIHKIMVLSNADLKEPKAPENWAELLENKGVALLMARLERLANRAAQKAVLSAGEKGLEKTVFRGVFETIGAKLTATAAGKSIPLFSCISGALMDAAVMEQVLDYSDIFYQKRFILEKEARVKKLLSVTQKQT